MTTIERFLDAGTRGLTWLPERGMGFYAPALEGNAWTYGRAYWERYEEYARNGLNDRLMDFRVSLVEGFGTQELIDVGIGCGAFIERRGGRTFGYDVNPVAVRWLEDRGLWRDLRLVKFRNASFWDVIEHVEDPDLLLENVMGRVFFSLPIFRGPEHVLTSKHFKPEHLWYWTRGGFVRWMEEHGFDLEMHGTQETYIGREDIHSFVFKRVRSV